MILNRFEQNDQTGFSERILSGDEPSFVSYSDDTIVLRSSPCSAVCRHNLQLCTEFLGTQAAYLAAFFLCASQSHHLGGSNPPGNFTL